MPKGKTINKYSLLLETIKEAKIKQKEVEEKAKQQEIEKQKKENEDV